MRSSVIQSERIRSLRNINPKFTIIGLTVNQNNSDYNALQAQYQRRLSHGLQALASYTWAHSIDNASSDTAFTSTITDPQNDRGASDFDIRHSFSAALSYNLPAARLHPDAQSSRA